MNLSTLLGGSGQSAPIGKDRHALPDPVMPFPKPEEEPAGPRFGSGSHKQMMRNRQAKFATQTAKFKEARMRPDEFLGGLAKLAHDVAGRLGIALEKPQTDPVLRAGTRGLGFVTDHRHTGSVSALLIRNSAKCSKAELATADELATLKKLSVRWDDCHAAVGRLAPSSERVRQLLDEDQARAGTSEYRGLDPDAVRQRCIGEMRPFKHQLSSISSEAAGIAKVISGRAKAAVEARLELCLADEIKAAERNGIAFFPSLLATTLKKAITTLSQMDFESLHCDPRAQILGLTGLLLDELEAKK